MHVGRWDDKDRGNHLDTFLEDGNCRRPLDVLHRIAVKAVRQGVRQGSGQGDYERIAIRCRTEWQTGRQIGYQTGLQTASYMMAARS